MTLDDIALLLAADGACAKPVREEPFSDLLCVADRGHDGPCRPGVAA